MRMRLPSRENLALVLVVSLFCGLTPSAFAAELTLSSLSHMDGLTFEQPLTSITPQKTLPLSSLSFAPDPIQGLTLSPAESTVQQPLPLMVAPATPTDTPLVLSVASPSPTPSPSIQPTSSQTPLLTTQTAGSSPTTITPSATPTPTLQPSPTITPIPSPTDTPTPTPTLTPNIVSPSDLDATFSKYSDQYHVDKSLLIRIAKCESGFNNNAVNGDYVGMYQFATTSWIGTRTAMGLDTNPDLRSNSDEAVKTAAFKISRDGSGAWPHC